ncbi:uncharacterized protein LOC129774015 [Toxorhynchites rutilus septentrionalis]|uniref:uncharacterized protein LOC129774015 n=1 Tax=Toxorhynchites rutilus septentrionalis TaxID=329112 RepID=UPI00247A0202|nr:uncharacterized protein LOC129774015 [Toxorhynchites rutilus septentrionalis]
MFLDLMDASRDSDAVKLYHLEKCLIGDAKNVIDAATIRDGNYEHAWRLLKERYDNKRLIVDTHIQGIKNLPKMKKKSSKELRTLLDECTRHVEGLRFMEQELTEVSELFVVNILTAALDRESREIWEKSLNKRELPKYQDTIDFLQDWYLVLERCEEASSISTSNTVKQKDFALLKGASRAYHASTSPASVTCELCPGQHLNFKCPVFRNMSVAQRHAKIKEEKACFNCLRKGHQVSACPVERTCAKCAAKHHTLLHIERNQQLTTDTINQPRQPTEIQAPIPWQSVPPVGESVNASCSSAVRPTKHVLLLTAVVNVYDKDGSQINFLSEFMARTLAVTKLPANIPVIGIGGIKSHIRQKVIVQVTSNYSLFNKKMEILVTPRVTGSVPSTNIDISNWRIPAGMQLADPFFQTPGKVDKLIGAEFFFELMMQGQLHLSHNLPLLQETKFGWIVTGVYEEQPTEVYSNVASMDDLHHTIHRFWEIEDLGSTLLQSNEQQEVEDHFHDTYRRDENGRFVVQLPFRDSVVDLPSNRSLALKRFFLLERRLARQPELKQQYTTFIKEYQDLGHCKEVRESDDPPAKQVYYLPHHAVLKPSSTTTKVRVVFDGTAKSSTNYLNDVLKVGPTVQSDLFLIVLRFRKYRYAFTADVCKMYRQIRVDERQTCFQRIFWRDKPTESLRVLELTTVTYGTASAAYLATRSLRQLAEDEGDNYPTASKVVQDDFYIDDVLSGADTIHAAIQLQFDLQELLARGAFPLRKWCSNSPEVLRNVPEEDRELIFDVDGSSSNASIKTLGLLWDPTQDDFRIAVSKLIGDKPITKRYVFSEIAKMFDPLGFVSPVLVLAKALMQRIWSANLEWDDILDPILFQEWVRIRDSLTELSTLRIPRCVISPDTVRCDIHGFADASGKAYGACLYLACTTADGKKSARLLCSKSKIAPLTEMPIPRKELCAALLLARLLSKVLAAIKSTVDSVKLYSDSQIVLAWLKKPQQQLEVFQRNRVVEINRLTKSEQWRYVHTSENPADIISRGLFPAALNRNRLWWEGPSFLTSEDPKIDDSPLILIPDEELPEVMGDAIAVPSVAASFLPIFERSSDFRRLQRVIAFVLRYVSNLRHPKPERNLKPYLSVPEIRSSLECIIRLVQSIEYPEEISCISRGEVPKKLANLSPFMDDKGLLRVGGRLQNSSLRYNSKHQLLLPHGHPVVEALVRAIHVEHLHVGPSGLLAILREMFWITRAKSTVRKVCRRCISCFKVNSKESHQLMGNLPQNRVVPAFPFENTGVDYAGPITIKEGRYKPKHVKGYIAVFLCLATKGIHLELVSDLSTEAFLAAMDRFVNRRGLVKRILSDHATNFTGASKELHHLYQLLKDETTQAKIVEFLLSKEIEWLFIPPRATNFGGLWEAGVKSVKTHLKRVLQSAILTFEEFYTVLTHIEAVLNSRPLYALSEDPNDPLPITPAHLMLLRPLEPVPKPTHLDVPVHRLSRWQYLNFLRDHFWKRWSKEYLSTLQARSKWTRTQPNLQPDMIVVIVEDNSPAQSWNLGRIIKTYPGRDTIVRVADVKTATGIYRRAASKLIPLPTVANDELLSARGECTLPSSNERPQPERGMENPLTNTTCHQLRTQ